MKSKIHETKATDNLSFLLILLFSISAITSPFWHIFYERGADDGVFGFSSMRSFLYTFGSHYILFGASVFMFWLIGFIKDKGKFFNYFVSSIAILFSSVSLYYLVYIFIPSNSPYLDYMYEICILACSIAISLAIFFLFQFYRSSKLQEKKETDEFISNSFRFIDEVNNALIK